MDERSSLGTISKREFFFWNARARNTHFEATLNLSCPAQVCILFGAGELLWQKVINFVLRITKERAAEGPSAFREAGLLKFGSGKIALHGSVRDNTRSITSSQRSARSTSSRRRRQQKYAAQPSGGSEKSLST